MEQPGGAPGRRLMFARRRTPRCIAWRPSQKLTGILGQKNAPTPDGLVLRRIVLGTLDRGRCAAYRGGMSMKEIQETVRRLPAAKRRRLTIWMVREFPVLTVDRLMTKAVMRVGSTSWIPSPPKSENVPIGATLEHVKRTARRLGIAQ